MTSDANVEQTAARRRHPTALWVPNVEEIRRRLLERTTPATVAQPHLQDERHTPDVDRGHR